LNIPTTFEVCDWLIDASLLRQSDAERGRRLLDEGEEGDLVGILQRLGVLPAGVIADAYASLMGVPRLDVTTSPTPPDEDAAPSLRFMHHHGLVPISIDQADLLVAVSSPVSNYALQAIAYYYQRPVTPVVGTPAEVQDLIERLYGQGRTAMGALVETLDEPSVSAEDIEHLKDLASEAPVIRMVNLVMQRAVEQRASDIHIEPFETQLQVRYRIDGVLYDVEAPPASLTAAVISRIKIMARLDIAERRLPQDGRIVFKIQGRELDLRVSTVPTSFGESVVMRLLDRQTVNFDFESLGFDGTRLAAFTQVLEQPHGILLVTGPTGSGKTTTLYTALSRLNTPDRKIITVEDPVEYQLQGINQIQVKPTIGLDFSGALRSILRQDPDVIMIGEMRDLETCRIAIQASLTGHLVLSTLHTNSAAASITRLLDMGVESYLVASTVRAILAQRLVRRLDPATRISFQAPAELIAEHGLERYTDIRPIMLYRADQHAAGGGYQGRSAVTELLVMNDELRELLVRKADASSLQQAARRAGLRTLHEDGLRQAVEGITSLEEVLRLTSGD
jgi:general secretion pathway protein E